MPSLSLVERMVARLGARAVIVFDACQFRVSDEELRWYFERDAIVLLTGSKFFGGPGFCGAVVCPPIVTSELARNTSVPLGLSAYLTRSDVPAGLFALRSALRDRGPNVGLLLRWVCALEEMEAFVRHKAVLCRQIPAWVAGVRAAILRCGPYLELLPDEGSNHHGLLGGCSTILCVRMHIPGAGEPTLAHLRRVQLLLSQDLSDQLPATATSEEREGVQRSCVVGQPVWLGTFGVLRIALGAPVTRTWREPTGLAHTLQDDRYLLAKWVVIMKYLQPLSNGCHDDRAMPDATPTASECPAAS